MKILAHFKHSVSPIEYMDNTIEFVELAVFRDYNSYDLVIIPSHLAYAGSSNKVENESTNRVIAGKLNAAREKGTHICIVMKRSYWGPIFQHLIPSEFVSRATDSLEDILAETSEMENLLKIYGKPETYFEYPHSTFPEILPILRNNLNREIVYGFLDKSYKGYLFTLPVYPPSQDELGFIKQLIPAIFSQLEKQQSPDNPISNDFKFSKEKELFAKKTEIEEQLNRLMNKLGEYKYIKSILFLRDDPLANALPNWFQENFGISTKREENYVEDFWLTKDDENIAICEAKGLSKNVRREHVTQLIQSRQRRDLPDEFPAILVVNTFANVETVHEKDKQQIPSDVIRWAVKNNALVVRTLDLIRLADLIELEKLSQGQISEHLLTYLGWLHVTRDYEIQEIRE